MIQKYTLNKAQFQFLKSGLKPYGILTPEGEVLPRSEEDLKGLMGKGYINNDYVIEGELSKRLTVLTKPRGIMRIRLINFDTNYEVGLYCRDGEKGITALYDTQEGVAFEYPFDTSSWLEGMSQYTGQSILKSTDINWDLTVDEAIVICAVMDLMRSKIKAAAQDDAGDSISMLELKSYLQNEGGTDDFSTYVSTITEKAVSSVDAEQALAGLKEKNLLGGSSTIELMYDALSVCVRFNVFKNVLRITTAYDDGDKGISSELMVLQDGVTDMLAFDVRSDRVLVRSVSALEILDIMNQYGEDPLGWLSKMFEEVQSPKKDTVAPAPAEEAVAFCPNCGTKRQQGSKFCGNCGKGF